MTESNFIHITSMKTKSEMGLDPNAVRGYYLVGMGDNMEDLSRIVVDASDGNFAFRVTPEQRTSLVRLLARKKPGGVEVQSFRKLKPESHTFNSAAAGVASGVFKTEVSNKSTFRRRS